jgi:hypothetical protein
MKPVLLLLLSLSIPAVVSAAPAPTRTLQSGDVRTQHHEQKAQYARDASVDMLRQMLVDDTDVDRKHKLMFRLADLLSQRSRARLLAAMEACSHTDCEVADEAVVALGHRVKLRPDSKRAGDAWLLIGEHHFEHDDATARIYRRAALLSVTLLPEDADKALA